MNHGFKFYLIVIAGSMALAHRAPAQCFVCSDGNRNTAVGSSALPSSFGADNTATGVSALYSDSSGAGNTATGYLALYGNTTGSYNTAIGYESLPANVIGSYTTAVGAYALQANTTGGYDTAFGAYALVANSTGSGNTAFGYAGLRSLTTGSSNIGFGYQALYSNTTGSNNIAMGYQGGYHVLNGSNNIEIGSPGSSADNNVIRIGSQGTQTNAYMAGISGAQITGSAVYVTSSGQLGVMGSSERYKTDVATMPEVSAKLGRLRPVTFHYKHDSARVLQYGLIAEEVAKVYPELVIRDDAGKIQGVRYEELGPMLLGEVQRQQATVRSLSEQIQSQAAEIRDLKKLVTELGNMSAAK